ncbi:MAG: baseplate J/gp47 family protein [Spirochaetes bacterium]|nr:baseplate J/gp47 family protein [Spirochaetota bacterium]
MPLPSPTLSEITALIIGDIEAALAQTIPIIPKAVWRIVARALAGAWLILYKYGTALHRERFVQTASLTYLKYLGELVRVFQQPASTWNGTAEITATGSTGTLEAGTQFVFSASGVVYTVDTSVAITPGTLTLSLTAGTSGDIGTLSNGSVLDIVTPIAGVGMTATVASTVTSGDDAEDTETYRQRVLDAYQKKPQGGASADYEAWGKEAPNVVSIYPYSAATPGQVDIYCEVDDQPDGIPTSGQLDEIEEYMLYDMQTQRGTRKPMTAELNVYAITRRLFDIQIENLSPDIPATRAAIDDAVDAYLQERTPYIRGLSIIRRDTVSQIEIQYIVFSVISALGATISKITLSDITGAIDLHVLGAGEKAKLGTVTYIP